METVYNGTARRSASVLFWVFWCLLFDTLGDAFVYNAIGVDYKSFRFN